MQKRLLTLLVLILSVTVRAQTWTNAYSFNSGASTNQNSSAATCHDASGNKYVTGWFSGTVDFDPGAGVSNLVTGNATSLVICNTFLSKYDASGNFQYAVKVANSNNVNAIAVNCICTDGTYIYIYGAFVGTATFGSTNLTAGGSGTYDLFLAKIQASDGSIVWAKKFGGTNADFPFGICLDDVGDIYISGYFSNATTIGSISLTSPSYAEAFSAKVNKSDGSVAWATHYGNSAGNSEGSAGGMVYAPSTGKVYALGSTNCSADETGNYGSFSVPLKKYDNAVIVEMDPSTGNIDNVTATGVTDNGAIIWGGCYDPATKDIMVSASYSGALALPGLSALSAGSTPSGLLMVARYSPATHNYVWAQSFATSGTPLKGYRDSYFGGLCSDGHGQIYTAGGFWATISIGGDSYTSATGTNMVLASFDAYNGDLKWHDQIDDGVNSSDNLNAVTVDDQGKFLVVGYGSNGTLNFGSITLPVAYHRSHLHVFADMPLVTTTATSGLTTTTATIGGQVMNDGGNSVTAKGIVYTTSGVPDMSSTVVAMGSGTTGFSQTLTGLSASTKYYIRPYITTSAGTFLGAVDSFTTNALPPAPPCKEWQDHNLGEKGRNSGLYTSTTAADGTQYVAFTDTGAGHKISVARLDTNGWQFVGARGFSESSFLWMDMTTDKYGNIYVAYHDDAYNDAISVKKFDGTSWSTVGSSVVYPNPIGNALGFLNIRTDTAGVPYVCFNDGSADFSVRVEKFDGTNWVLLGTSGFGDNISNATTPIAFDKNNHLYVAYSTKVKMYNGTDWVLVASNSAMTSVFDMAADTSGNLYITSNASNKANVYKFDGSTIALAGNANFSAGLCSWVKIAINKQNQIYTSFTDFAASNKLTVMTLNGGTWSYVLSQGISGGTAPRAALAIGKYDYPFAVYRDGTNGNRLAMLQLTPQKPTINASLLSTVYSGSPNAYIHYNTPVFGPTQYSVTWSASAHSAGFSDMDYTSLGIDSIALSIPTTVAVDTYAAKIVCRNSDGCTGDTQIVRIAVLSNNITPSFTLSSPQSISLCQNATAMDVKSLLHVADADEEQNLTWTVSNAAAHGTVTVTGATASTGGSDIAPGGTITYQPTTGYSGADSFTIQVSDGIATATQKIRVTVKGGPAITTQPVSDTVCGGGTGIFTVAAGEPVLSYQWQVGGDGVNFSDVGFATSSTFTVPPPVGSTISGAFVRCVLTGTCGAGNSDVVRFIMSSPNATITTVPVSCNGGSNGRATATVGGGLPPYTYSWSPVGGSLASASGLTARVYTVTVQDAFGCQTQRATTVTQPSAITASVSDQTNVVCYGAATGAIAVSASGGAGALSYSWAPTGGTLATATGLAAGTYTCTISDTNSCSRTQTATITQPGVYSVAVTAQHNVSCAGGNTGDAAISVTGGQTPFNYSWVPSVSSATSAAGLTAGIYTATVTDDNGCEASKVITITEPAALNVSITSQTNVTCHGGSNGLLQASATGGVPTYDYSWSPAGTSGTVATGLTAGSQTVTVTDDNGCTATANTVVTEPALFTATISGATTICNGTGTTVTISSDPNVIVGYTVNGGTVQHAELNSLGEAVLNTGNITGTTVYALTDVSNGVCNNSVTGSVTINTFDIPVINDVASQVICNNSTTDAVTFTGTAVTYTWSNSNTSIGLATSGSGNIAAFTAVNATNTIKTGTITVTPKSGECIGTPVNFTIAVKPTPTVNANADLAGCNGDAFDGVAFTGNMTGTAYNWINSDASIGVAGSGVGDIFEFDGVNANNFTHTASVVVTPTNNGCTGSADTLTITVYPTPTVNATVDMAVCNGLVQPAINFTGSVSGTVFNWNNSNTSIGLDATNTTDIASFTAVNSGVEPVTATVTVLPAANGCVGTRDTFTITVNPTPVADALTGQDRCNGAATLPVAFNSTTTGTAYTWSNSDNSIGLASTGTGNVASFAAVNSGSATTTATVTVTPAANGCTGPDVTMIYTVYPTPHMTPIADQSLCNGFNTTAITFGSSVAGSEYSWTNTNSLIGLALFGSTTGIPSFPANNSGTATLVSTIVVTPTANECVGTTDTFTYTVTPTPVVFAVGSQLLCNTDTTAVINFGGTVPGTVYSWTNSNAAIGLAATGTGDIAAFPAVNAGNVFDTATIVVLPSIGACEGATQTFNIVVKPTPTVDAVSNQVLCNGAATTDVTFTGAVAGTTNNWVNTNTAIGLVANGTGNILSFAATNTTVAPISGTVTVTPTANGCTGASRNFTYTVNPTPKFTTSQTGTVCSGAPYTYVPASATTGVSYAWTRAAAAGISNAAGSGSGSVGETLYNTTMAAKTATYHYTLTANGCSNQQNVVVTVDPTPQAPVITVTSPANVCSQTMNMNFGAATTQPDTVQYTWTADGATVLAQGAGHQNAIISFPTAGDVTVVLTANATGFSCTAKDTFQVNVGSAIANNAEIYYIHDHFFYTDNTVDNYQWGYDDAATLDSVIYTGQVDQNLYLPSPDFAGKKYWVMVNKGGCLSKIYYNAPTGVANVNTGATISINVYPNPATNNVAVSVDGLAGGNNRVELTDMTGKVINISELENNHAILNVNDLASGVYIISCYHNGVKAGSAKVVKE